MRWSTCVGDLLCTIPRLACREHRINTFKQVHLSDSLTPYEPGDVLLDVL